MQDARGNPTSAPSRTALDRTEQALWRMVSFYGTPVDDLDAAAAAAPGWVLPKLMRAGFLLSLTDPALVEEASAALEQAAPLLAHAHDRERAHHAALVRLRDGDWHGARGIWEALLLAHPRDALALAWAHLFDFYCGDALNLRQRVARVLPEWDEQDPLWPYALGMLAFGLEESNLYPEAEAAGRRALAGTARVPWAIHAVAHVMEMQGRFDDGIAWMERWRHDWTDGNGFATHLGWHQALFAIESLDTGTALRLFDAHMAAASAQATLDRLDAAALLWRLQLLEVDVGTRWRELVDSWHLDDGAAGFYAFNDLHVLLGFVGAGELDRAEAWLRRAAAQAEARGGSNDAMMREVGAPLMSGVLAFARGRHDAAVAHLYPTRATAHRFGGSHAQRDVIDQTVLAAAAQAIDRSAGRALVNERRIAKAHTPLTAHWARRFDLGTRPVAAGAPAPGPTVASDRAATRG